MSHDHALKLFSKHAFGVDYPPEDYASLSEDFIQVATGLPLYLKVIGSLLFKTDKRFWEDKLIELEEIPPAKVQERLKISYNELTHTERQIFLDVACFFIGVYKQAPIWMWSDCDFYPTSAMRTLIQRSLLKIDNNNLFRMHDHVRDLGRAIIREENNQNPYKRSRMWSDKGATTDAIDMIKHKEGTDSVEALTVDMQGENLVLTNKELKKLTRLRYFDLSNGRLAGNFKDVLPNIRWLGLCNCNSVPVGLNLEKLVILRLKDCSVSDGWKGWQELKVARKLKVVSLRGCSNLKKVPDFSNCGGLDFLDFSKCLNMQGELDIRNFKNLRFLGISETKIIEVPTGISKLSSLEYLDLTLTHPNKTNFTEMLPKSLKILAISSSSLSALPSSLTYLKSCYCEHLPNLANLTNLSKLVLMDTEIAVEEPLHSVVNLATLVLMGVELTNMLPLSLSVMTKLRKLVVWHMSLIRFPDLSNLKNLRQLKLNDISICVLLGLGELKLLETLNIERAPNLVNLDGLESLVLLKQLSLEGCTILEKLPSLAALSSLELLQIESCPVITEIRGAGGLWESLSELDVRRCSRLTDIGALHSMNLRLLGIINCNQLIEVTGVDTLESLEFLSLALSGSMKKLPGLSRLVKLKTLDVAWCTQFTEIRGLGKLELLEYLDMSRCESIKELPNLSGLKNLNKLRLKGCRQLKEVKGIEELESLQVLNLSWCANLEKVPDLSNCRGLELLHFRGCRKLIEVTGLDMLELLERLELEGCRSIKMLPDLSGLVKLTTFTIRGCTQLTEVRGLGRLESLLHLWIFGCQSIKELPNLSGLKNLTIFHVTKCRQLKEVNGLEGLKSLQVFEMDKRLKVKHVLKSFSRHGKQLVTRSVRRALFINN
ncbi:Disease resistance protein L6 [Linum perenne]